MAPWKSRTLGAKLAACCNPQKAQNEKVGVLATKKSPKLGGVNKKKYNAIQTSSQQYQYQSKRQTEASL